MLKDIFTGLSELHLCDNGLNKFPLPHKDNNNNNNTLTGFTEITLLNLENNQISDWNEIHTFSSLPKYVSLVFF